VGGIRVESLCVEETRISLSLWLPAIRAQLALNRKNPAAAIESLQAAVPIELGQIAFVTNLSCLYPTYIRGEAYPANRGCTRANLSWVLPVKRSRADLAIWDNH
jgi:hypothetical protein